MSEAASSALFRESRVASRYRPLQFWLVILAATAAAFARFAISPLQETMRTALALSDHQAALLQGPALAIPMVLAAVPLGILIDRYSRVKLICIFAAFDLVGTLLTAFAWNFSSLFVARCLVGLAVAAISTTSFSLLADLFIPARRGRASMVVVVGQYGGMSAAFAVGAALLGIASPGLENWRWAMLWLSAPLALAAVLSLLMHEPARIGIVVKRPSGSQTLRELWAYRWIVGPLIAGMVMAEVSVLAPLTWGAPALSRAFALSPERVGVIMAVALLVSGVIGPIAGGFVADYCQRTGGARRTVLVLSGLAVASVPLGCFPLADSVTSASALLLIFMTIVGATLVIGVTLFTIVIPNELRGLCMSLLAGAQVVLGVGFAPVLVSLISDTLGGPSAIGTSLALVNALAGATAATLFLLGRKHLPGASPH